MSHFSMDDSVEAPLGGRKGKTCSMSGCMNTHQRCPNISFFRFPKELSRAKEWLKICDRPDLLRRVDIGDITINNYYVCETHFPNQILDYATRKILIKTAKPLTFDELKAMPKRDHKKSKPRRHSSNEYDMHIEQDFDDFIDDDDEDDDGDYEQEDSKDGIKLGHFGVKIAKAEGNYHSDLLEPLHDDYTDTVTRVPYVWTPEATRMLIKLRTERNADFEQSGARKSQIWLEICSKMRAAGYDFTPEKVSKKWHNITITYQKNTEKDPDSVNWEFFNDMHSVFQNKKMQEDNSNDYADVEPVKQNGITKQKANGAIGDRITQTPDSGSYTSNVRESLRIKRQRRESDENHIMHADTSIDVIRPQSNAAAAASQSIDESWWKNYFEQKLELERKRMEKEDERHKDRMNFQKMAIMLQERVEKIKIEAMKNLTTALLRLQESGKQ